MSFLYPHILWFLLLPLCLGIVGIILRQQVGNAWKALVSSAHESELVQSRPAWRTILPTTLALIALACGIFAAARPILGYTETKSSASGRNLIIALDISRSMETNDVSPSRLEEARAAAYELIDALPAERIGLIVFSGDADLVVPLTYDHAALRSTLEQIDRRWTTSGGTNFGRLLEKAMQDFRRSAPHGTNALVILSDGEDTVDTSGNIAEQAKENKLLVITVGIGTTTGAAIPDPQGENGLWQDANGKHVISKLNEESLQQFAEATNGSYFAMSSGTDLAAFAKQAVSKLDRHEEQFSATKVPNDIFEYFAAAALVLLLFSITLGTDWGLPRVRNAIIGMLFIFCTHQQAVYAQDDAATNYARGLGLMQNNNNAAKEALSLALLSPDKSLQSAALHALGNINNELAFQKLRDLYQPEQTDEEETPQASSGPGPEELKAIVAELNKNIKSYDDALSISPSLTPARNNKTKVLQLIKKLEEEIKRLEEQQKQQQQDKQNQQQQDKQDQQDQQNQQPQDKQDQQDKQNQQPQDKQDRQDSQNQQQQDKQDQQDSQNQQQQDKQDRQDSQNQQPKLSDEEKNRRRAASILQMHIDEEKGSPLPQFQTTQPVLKDY